MTNAFSLLWSYDAIIKTSWRIARRAGQAGAQAGAAARRVHVCCETFACARTRSCVPCATYVCCYAYIRAVALLYERMSYTCVLWVLQMCCGSCMSDACVLWLFVCATHVCCDSYICAVAYSSVNLRVCHDSSMCAMTHTCVSWVIEMWYDASIPAMTHSKTSWANWSACSSCAARRVCVCCDSFVCAMTYACVLWLMHGCHDSSMRAVTHSPVS